MYSYILGVGGEGGLGRLRLRKDERRFVYIYSIFLSNDVPTSSLRRSLTWLSRYTGLALSHFSLNHDHYSILIYLSRDTLNSALIWLLFFMLVCNMLFLAFCVILVQKLQVFCSDCLHWGLTTHFVVKNPNILRGVGLKIESKNSVSAGFSSLELN